MKNDSFTATVNEFSHTNVFSNSKNVMNVINVNMKVNQFFQTSGKLFKLNEEDEGNKNDGARFFYPLLSDSKQVPRGYIRCDFFIVTHSITGYNVI